MAIDKEFETIAWAQLRVDVKVGRLFLGDLFVKPETRTATLPKSYLESAFGRVGLLVGMDDKALETFLRSLD